MNLYEFIRKTNAGGCIVSASNCTAEQIATARAAGNVWSDGEGMAFVYLPGSRSSRRSDRSDFGLNAPVKAYLPMGVPVDPDKLQALADFAGCDIREVVMIRSSRRKARQ